MVDYGMEAVLIKVACYGLNKTHLGRTIKDLSPYFDQLFKECEMHVCG
jgi:diphthine-ammonia ligase